MNEQRLPVRHVRLMTDWSLPPVYTGTGNGLLDLTEPEELIDLFGVPHEVVDAVEGWYAKLQSVLNWDYPPDTDWKQLHEIGFYEDGRRAAALLRRHLPADVTIEFCGNDDIPSEYF